MKHFKSFEQFIAESKINEQAKYTTNPNHSLIALNGLVLLNQIRIFHWQTEIEAQHEALGEFYENLSEMNDTLTETMMGKYGRFTVSGVPCKEYVDLKDINCDAFIDEFCKFYQDAKTQVFSEDAEIQNIVDEIIAEIQKLKYLLTLA